MEKTWEEARGTRRENSGIQGAGPILDLPAFPSGLTWCLHRAGAQEISHRWNQPIACHFLETGLRGVPKRGWGQGEGAARGVLQVGGTLSLATAADNWEAMWAAPGPSHHHYLQGFSSRLPWVLFPASHFPNLNRKRQHPLSEGIFSTSSPEQWPGLHRGCDSQHCTPSLFDLLRQHIKPHLAKEFCY